MYGWLNYIGNKVSSRSSSSVSLSRSCLGPGVVLVITGGLCMQAGIDPLDLHTRSQPSYNNTLHLTALIIQSLTASRLPNS